MPSSIVYGVNSGSVSVLELPSASAQVLMSWVRRTAAGSADENIPIFGFTRNDSPTGQLEGNWGLTIGTSSANSYVRLQSTYWTATTQSISSSTDWYFVVLQRPTGSANVNLRMFRDDGPTFTKEVELSIFSPSRPGRIVIYSNASAHQFTGMRYFTGSTFTDAQCREQATYRFPPTHSIASLYDYWIMETATQLTGSVSSTILSGSTPALSASSAPISIRPAQRLRYVNTNSTGGGNGTTNATAGANRAYPSLREAWLTQSNGTNNTLLTTDQYLEIQCTGGPVDIDTSLEALYFAMGTDETRYALITAAPGQEATIPMDRNRYIFSGSFSIFSCRNVRVTNLQLEKSSSSAGDSVLSYGNFAESSSGVFANNTILQRGVGTAITAQSRTTGSQVFLINNFITASSQAVYGVLTQTAGAPFVVNYLYNNTVVGAQRAYYNTFYGPNDSIYFKNNLGVNSSAACFGNESTPTSQSFENNASSDNTGPANTVGGATLRNRTFTFRNSQSGDYRLRGDDTGARKLGVNLSSDPYYPFTTDRTGQDRNRNGWWDIGADQADIGYTGFTTQATGSFAVMKNTGSRGLVVGVT